jgi:hypothetical protein
LVKQRDIVEHDKRWMFAKFELHELHGCGACVESRHGMPSNAEGPSKAMKQRCFPRTLGSLDGKGFSIAERQGTHQEVLRSGLEPHDRPRVGTCGSWGQPHGLPKVTGDLVDTGRTLRGDRRHRMGSDRFEGQS